MNQKKTIMYTLNETLSKYNSSMSTILLLFKSSEQFNSDISSCNVCNNVLGAHHVAVKVEMLLSHQFHLILTSVLQPHYCYFNKTFLPIGPSYHTVITIIRHHRKSWSSSHPSEHYQKGCGEKEKVE